MSYTEDTCCSRDSLGIKKADFYNCHSPSCSSIETLKANLKTENDINKFIISKFEAFDFAPEFCSKWCIIPADSPVHGVSHLNNPAIKDGFNINYQLTKESSLASQTNISNFISTENDDIYKDECLSVAFSSEYDDI